MYNCLERLRGVVNHILNFVSVILKKWCHGVQAQEDWATVRRASAGTDNGGGTIMLKVWRRSFCCWWCHWSSFFTWSSPRTGLSSCCATLLSHPQLPKIVLTFHVIASHVWIISSWRSGRCIASSSSLLSFSASSDLLFFYMCTSQNPLLETSTFSVSSSTPESNRFNLQDHLAVIIFGRSCEPLQLVPEFSEIYLIEKETVWISARAVRDRLSMSHRCRYVIHIYLLIYLLLIVAVII